MKLRSILAFLVVFVLLFAAAEYKSGQQAWNAAEAAYLADGESLDPTIRFAAAVPDEQNFAAIPELVGITKDDPEGEAVRDNLKALAFKRDGFRWPRVKGRSKEYHAPRVRYDLRAMHSYFREADILPLSVMPESHASDIFNGIEKAHGGLISALHAARDRPRAICLPLNSEISDPDTILFAETRPQLQTLQTIAKGLRIHALAAIASDHPKEATKSLETMLRLAEAATSDSNCLINHLVAIALRNMAVETAWEGLESNVWNAEQLLKLQSSLQASSPRKDLANSIRGELIGVNDIYNHLESSPRSTGQAFGVGVTNGLSLIPLVPWIPHNRAASLTSIHQGILAPVKAGQSYNEVTKSAESQNEILESSPKWNLRNIITRLSTPTFTNVVKKTGQSDANLTQAATACALERYQLEHKSYPDKLEALVPKFIAELPIDPMDNQTMRYQKTSDGRYQLHSIGSDGNDDAGNKGDLTWNYKPAPEED